MTCRICQSPSRAFGRARVLGRHDVGYHRCERCGFVQTDEPFWLDEAYSEAITNSDLGLVSRNLQLAPVVLALAVTMFDPAGRFVDYGGGYGMLVRLLRDAGLDFYRSDRYCRNLFAVGFDAPEPELASYELLTAIEVFEHLVDPVAEVERMLGFSRSLFFTTQLVPAEVPPPDSWWYYGLEHGQHVSFYTRDSLRVLGERFGLTLYSRGPYHLLSDRKLSAARFNLVTRVQLASVLAPFLRRPTLLPADAERVVASLERRP